MSRLGGPGDLTLTSVDAGLATGGGCCGWSSSDTCGDLSRGGDHIVYEANGDLVHCPSPAAEQGIVIPPPGKV